MIYSEEDLNDDYTLYKNICDPSQWRILIQIWDIY